MKRYYSSQTFIIQVKREAIEKSTEDKTTKRKRKKANNEIHERR